MSLWSYRTKRTEIEVIASKLKKYILASKSIKVSAYQCDVGVNFEQVTTRKIMVGKELIFGANSVGKFPE